MEVPTMFLRLFDRITTPPAILIIFAIAALIAFTTAKDAPCHNGCGGYCSPTQLVCQPGCGCNFVTSNCR